VRTASQTGGIGGGGGGELDEHVMLTPWALLSVLVGVLSAAAARGKLPHTILTLVS